MDLVCDNVVEGILLRLPLKYLHRLRAVSRRYNALVLDPGFASRYWRSHGPHLSGVFLQTEALIRPWGHRPLFLAASGSHPSATDSVLASDLGFLSHLPQLHVGIGDLTRMIFIVHSSGGLLLCSLGVHEQVHYYVCNPVTWQLVALPELPWPGYYKGLLSVATYEDGSIKSFRVVLVSYPEDWKRQGQGDTMFLDLKVFSSDTSQWRAMKLRVPSLDLADLSSAVLGQSGTAYWIGYSRGKDRAIAYDSVCHSVEALPLPNRNAKDALNRCLGEVQGGILRYAHFDVSVFEVWDQERGDNDMRWKLVHRIGVMELAQQNPVATNFACNSSGVVLEGLINSNSLFTVTGFHPTAEDIVFLDVGRNVATYSFKNGTIRFQSPRHCFRMEVFPYVHPAHPILIPEIKKSSLAHLEMKNLLI